MATYRHERGTIELRFEIEVATPLASLYAVRIGAGGMTISTSPVATS
jgi:hypothetical protein